MQVTVVLDRVTEDRYACWTQLGAPGHVRRAMRSRLRVGDFVTGRHFTCASHQYGPFTYGMPSIMRICQPPVSMVRWWNQQSNTPLSVWVGPPRECSSTWWISHHRG